ncbi:MAG TPA: M1 family aminopeptidase [Chitinophagales bacterium]|nr:M1 family aminopeptidase [Chitinophagales bacterium]
MLREKWFLLILTACMQQAYAATPTISDSIDIRHYDINLDITDYAGQTINGSTTLHIAALVDGITTLPLDLLSLDVDGITDGNGNALSFTYDEPSLIITLFTPLNIGDSANIIIQYSGDPAQDGSWGGWYWSGDYSYQLGVGFDAIPHNYGRAWFPCFDNFIERSTFSYDIKTTNDKKAFCGGLLIDSVDNGDGTISWHWECVQQIPSYLASVAVSKYATINDVYAGIAGDIPIQLACKAEDTTDMKNSFIHLHDALSTFENHYGPFRWDRVGYAVVPFSGGAMEHAMNIAYPLFAVNGTTLWENLYAHELSHHWWGDLTTCSTPQEMWMNEGWAVFSEHLFQESLYGEQAYMDAVKANQLDVLHNAAPRDGNNYFAISVVPESYTYGATTYNKGASVIHTLRGYMGDDAFFSCITSFMETYQFQPVSAANLRDHLTACSGMDMSDFFDDWVYQPGSLAFDVLSTGGNKGTITCLHIQQYLSHATHYGNNVPLTAYFFDYNFNLFDSVDIVMSGDRQLTTIEVPNPGSIVYTILDYRNKLNDAVTSDEVHFTEPGTYSLDNAMMDIEITSVTYPGFIYAQHFWAAPNNYIAAHPGLHVSTDRFWRITTNIPVTGDATAKFLYNGQATIGSGYLDNDFITNSEDSLVLLYRNGPQGDWIIYPDYTLNTWGSANDKRGAFELSAVTSGDFCIGIYDASIPDQPLYIPETDCSFNGAIENLSDNSLTVYPIPANQLIVATVDQQLMGMQLSLYDTSMRKIWTGRIDNLSMSIPTQNLPAGTYQLCVENARSERIAAEKVLIMH